MPHFIGRSFPRETNGFVDICPMLWFLVGISAAQTSKIGPKTVFRGSAPKTIRPKGEISEYSLHTGGEFPWTCFGAPNVCSKSPIFWGSQKKQPIQPASLVKVFLLSGKNNCHSCCETLELARLLSFLQPSWLEMQSEHSPTDLVEVLAAWVGSEESSEAQRPCRSASRTPRDPSNQQVICKRPSRSQRML